MSNKDKIVRGLNEAIAHAKGEDTGARTITFSPPDHTPTPWRLIEDWTAEIIGADGSLIGKIIYPDKINDARLIIEAVNSRNLHATRIQSLETGVSAALTVRDGKLSAEDFRTALESLNSTVASEANKTEPARLTARIKVLEEALETSRRNIISLRDAGLLNAMTEWLRVVEDALTHGEKP